MGAYPIILVEKVSKVNVNYVSLCRREIKMVTEEETNYNFCSHGFVSPSWFSFPRSVVHPECPNPGKAPWPLANVAAWTMPKIQGKKVSYTSVVRCNIVGLATGQQLA